MAGQLYILDFDRTVFDTSRFFTDLKAVLHQHHAIASHDLDTVIDQLADPSNPTLDFYDLLRPLTSAGPTEIAATIDTHLASADYSYPDADLWIRTHQSDANEIIILTVGHPSFQEIKFRHARAVDGLRKIIIPGDKGRLVLGQLHADGAAYQIGFTGGTYDSIHLVDDRPDTFAGLGFPPGITPVRIARPGDRYTAEPTPAGVHHITSFGELL